MRFLLKETVLKVLIYYTIQLVTSKLHYHHEQ
jgi:hypothetical protein